MGLSDISHLAFPARPSRGFNEYSTRARPDFELFSTAAAPFRAVCRQRFGTIVPHNAFSSRIGHSLPDDLPLHSGFDSCHRHVGTGTRALSLRMRRSLCLIVFATAGGQHHHGELGRRVGRRARGARRMTAIPAAIKMTRAKTSAEEQIRRVRDCARGCSSSIRLLPYPKRPWTDLAPRACGRPMGSGSDRQAASRAGQGSWNSPAYWS